jgi:exonuclease SbcD
MIKILHFSDAHIDIANHGKRDPQTGLAIRVLDFLKALDTIVDRAIAEKVDLVIFAGDAYRDRTPAPTFQREWGKRIKRLSAAGIQTLLVVGNHDISPAFGRAHAMQEYETLAIPHVKVLDRPVFLKPEDLEGLPIQVIALPWITRSGLIAAMQNHDIKEEDISEHFASRLTQIILNWIDESDPELPLIFTAHASVQGAVFGGERSVMLGNDQIIPGSLVKHPLIDYSALGHIHKPQNLNENAHPPVIYPGSIERVDFGEVADEKFFILADIKKGETHVQWVPLKGRHFLDHSINLELMEVNTADSGDLPSLSTVTNYIRKHLPEIADIRDAVTRLSLIYPRHWDALIDENWLRTYYEPALESQFVHKPLAETRLRISENRDIASLPAPELLKIYWKSNNVSSQEIKVLQEMAEKIIYNQYKEESLNQASEWES